MTRPASTEDLTPCERRFVAAMRQLGFGLFVSLKIRGGQFVLDPWPQTLRHVKFGPVVRDEARPLSDVFDLKAQVVELFEFVRSVPFGEIRRLEVRHGLPFAMEVDQPTIPAGDLSE
jgi:hypothetical protein